MRNAHHKAVDQAYDVSTNKGSCHTAFEICLSGTYPFEWAWLFIVLLLSNCIWLWFVAYWVSVIIYSDAIKNIQFFGFEYWVSRKWLRYSVYIVICQTSSSAKHKLEWSAVINKGVNVLNSNSVVPIKTRFVHSKWFTNV